MSSSDSDVEIVGVSCDVDDLPVDLASLLSVCNSHKLTCSPQVMTASFSGSTVSLDAYQSLTEKDKKRLRSVAHKGCTRDDLLAGAVVLLQGTEYMPSAVSPRTSWLSDTAINSYIDLIRTKLPPDRAKTVHVFNTFFFTKLCGTRARQGGDMEISIDYMAVQRWTKTNPMATKDLIVVPVHENMVHWCVLAVHVPSKTIFYLDSMFRHSQYYEEHRAHRLIRTLFAWVVLEAHDKKCWARVMKGHTPSVAPMESLHSALAEMSLGLSTGTKPCVNTYSAGISGNSTSQDFEGWKGVLLSNLPKQSDVSSCGVFTAAFVEMLMRGFGPPFSWHMEDIGNMRVGMAHLLIQSHEKGSSCTVQDLEVAAHPWL